MVTAISATFSATGRVAKAACATASTRLPCGSSRGRTWKRRVMAFIYRK